MQAEIRRIELKITAVKDACPHKVLVRTVNGVFSGGVTTRCPECDAQFEAHWPAMPGEESGELGEEDRANLISGGRIRLGED